MFHILIYLFRSMMCMKTLHRNHSDSNLTVLENTTFVHEFNASDQMGTPFNTTLKMELTNISLRSIPLRSPFILTQISNSLTTIIRITFMNSLSAFLMATMFHILIYLFTMMCMKTRHRTSTLTCNLTVLENNTFVHQFNASDTDGDTLSYNIEDGVDQHFFEINSTSGLLSFLHPRDFEFPDDNNSDNIYELSISVSDGNNVSHINLFVQVYDVYENDFDSFGLLKIEENMPIGSLVGQFILINDEPHDLSPIQFYPLMKILLILRIE